MNARSRHRPPRGARRLGALAGTLATGLLGFSADPAHAAYTAKVKGGTLAISGNGASDKPVLRLQPGSPTILQLDVGAGGTADFSFDRGTFSTIDVQAGRGDDEVRVDQTSGSFPDEALTIDGGAGADTLGGRSGAEMFVGGTENDVVSGGDGNDRALLGDGDDRFEWIPGDDSEIVARQRGSDLLDFFGSGANENIGVAANGQLARLTRNVASIVLDLTSVEHFAVHALGGTDAIDVGNLVGTGVGTVGGGSV